MLSGSWARYAPLAVLLFVALVVASIIIGGQGPDTDDSTQKVIHFWTSKDSKQITAAILSALATAPFLWFLGSLRSKLRVGEGDSGRLSAIAFGGGIVLATGALANAAFQFAAAESAGDVPPQVTQTLSVLYSDFFFPFPIGIGVLTLATALVILRKRIFPVWLGWVGLLLGIIAFTPVGFFAFFAWLAWIVILGVLMFRDGGASAAMPAAPVTG
jgi:hypothetical protein